MRWFLLQLRLLDQVKPQPFAARHVVGPARDLDQATPSVLGAVAYSGVAQVFAALVFGLSERGAPDLFDIFKLAGFVANLGDKCDSSLGAHNLVPAHRGV